MTDKQPAEPAIIKNDGLIVVYGTMKGDRWSLIDRAIAEECAEKRGTNMMETVLLRDFANEPSIFMLKKPLPFMADDVGLVIFSKDVIPMSRVPEVDKVEGETLVGIFVKGCAQWGREGEDGGFVMDDDGITRTASNMVAEMTVKNAFHTAKFFSEIGGTPTIPDDRKRACVISVEARTQKQAKSIVGEYLQTMGFLPPFGEKETAKVPVAYVDANRTDLEKLRFWAF